MNTTYEIVNKFELSDDIDKLHTIIKMTFSQTRICKSIMNN